jgi:DNA polymerase-3 subunit beta
MRKLQVDINTLTTALQIANKVICKKALTITVNFKFDVVNNKLTITTTDLENFIQTTIDCIAEESFSFLLPANELKLIEKLDEGTLTITLNDDDDNNVLKLSTDDENINVAIDNADYYPSMPKGNILKVGNFKNDFITEIKSCLNFIGIDDLRPAMKGINFQVENGEVELCATDAHTMRLVRIEGEQLTDAASLSIIINNKQCKILTNFKKLKDIELAVLMNNSITHSVINFTCQNIKVSIIGKNIDARFPNYKRILPDTISTVLKLNKSELSKRIEKAMLYSNNTTKQGVFIINGNVKLNTKDIDFNKEYSTVMQHTNKTGEDLEIAFNLDYVKKLLVNCEGEFVDLKFSGTNKPALLEEANSTLLIMPIMLN